MSSKKQQREQKIIRAAMRAGLSKSNPSDRVRNPAEDVQPTLVLGAPMEVDEKQSNPVPADANYCDFCGTNAPCLHRCDSCGAKVCQQTGAGGEGCLLGGGTTGRQATKCPQCVRLKKHDEGEIAKEVRVFINPH